MVKYSPGHSKENVRNHVFLYLKECNNILTLPNLYFSLEERFLKEGKSVNCTESLRVIYNKQLKIAPSEIKLFNKNIKNIDTSNYDGLFLDMCGPFSNAISLSLLKLNKGSKIVLTLLMARESKELQKFIDIKNREESYILLLNRFNIQVEKYITYCDTTPMIVLFGVKIK